MKTAKHQILKSKEGFSSQARVYEEFTTKTALRNELQRLNDFWSRNGQVNKFNKKDMILVVTEPDDSATYTFEYLEKY